MKLISHRGNLDGKTDRENQPDYIMEALSSGFDVEVDVWNITGRYLLGHDTPLYIVGKRFLQNDNLWCHAKNILALESMLKDNIHCFWHQEDDVTLTSKGYMWTYPGKELTDKSVVVMPEHYLEKWWGHKFEKQIGICSDYINKYRSLV